MRQHLTNLNASLQAWEERATGLLPPTVRRNMRVDLTAAMFFGPFVAGLAFLPVVMRRLGASPEWLAFYTVQNFIGFLLTPISALVMPRRSGLLRFGMTFWLLSRGSFLLIAFLADARSLILLTLFFWIVESFPVPVYTRLMQAAYPARSRGRVIALIRVGMSFTSLVVTPLAGWLLDAAGHRALFPLLSLSAVVSTVIFSRLQLADADLPESPPVSTAGLLRAALQDRRFLLYLAALVVFGLGLLSGLALQPLVQVDQLALSYGAIGLLSVVQSAFFLAGYVLWGRLIDRRGGVWVMRRVFLAAAVVPACYLFAVSGLAGSSAWLLAPAFAAMGLVNAGMDVGVLNTVMQLAPADRLGEYSALQTMVLGARGLIAPFLGVWLVQGLDLPYAVVFGLGLALIAAAVVVLLRIRVTGEGATG